jgi:hypothetical protein
MKPITDEVSGFDLTVSNLLAEVCSHISEGKIF